MNAREVVNGYLESLKKKLGIAESLDVDTDGFSGIRLVNGQQLNIEVLGGEDLVVFHTTLMELPEQDLENFLMRLLELNLFTYQTHLNSFGVNPDTREVILSRSIPAGGLSASQFEELCESLLSVGLHFQEQLLSHASVTAGFIHRPAAVAIDPGRRPIQA